MRGAIALSNSLLSQLDLSHEVIKVIGHRRDLHEFAVYLPDLHVRIGWVTEGEREREEGA